MALSGPFSSQFSACSPLQDRSHLGCLWYFGDCSHSELQRTGAIMVNQNASWHRYSFPHPHLKFRARPNGVLILRKRSLTFPLFSKAITLSDSWCYKAVMRVHTQGCGGDPRAISIPTVLLASPSPSLQSLANANHAERVGGGGNPEACKLKTHRTGCGTVRA